MTSFRTAALAAVICLSMSVAASAQPTISPTSSLVSDDANGSVGAFGDGYAADADTWGDWLFVGVPRETAVRDGLDTTDGAVYIYKRGAGGVYAFTQKIVRPGNSLPDGAGFRNGDRFGGGVDAEGGWLFVAAANDQDFPGLIDPREGDFNPLDPPFQFAGKVHVYKLNAGAGTWDYAQALTSPAPGSGGSFGTRTQASHMALDPGGKVAAIGELNNYPGAIGAVHIFRLQGGAWGHIQTLAAPAPLAAVPASFGDNFADGLTFADNKYLVVGGGDISDDALFVQGYAFVFKSKGSSGQFFSAPTQTIPGASLSGETICANNNLTAFGDAGMAAGGGVVVIAEPCVDGAAGVNTGRVHVYRVGGSGLTAAGVIEGDAPNLFAGSNSFGARKALAVNAAGDRIMIGAPVSPDGAVSPTAAGADVRVYAFTPSAGWFEESNLTSATSATFRLFGDVLIFTDNETAFVREGNFLNPAVGGSRKGQGFFYDLTP